METLLRNAVAATGATAGWVVALADDGMRVCAYCGPDDPAGFLGVQFGLAEAGSAGLAAVSGQPIAVRPRPGDVLVARGPMSLLTAPPASYVTIPCSDEEGIVGVLEVVDKQAAASFDIDDVELLSLLGDIAAAVLRERSAPIPPPAPPAGPASGGGPLLPRLAAERPAVHRALLGLLDALEEA